MNKNKGSHVIYQWLLQQTKLHNKKFLYHDEHGIVNGIIHYQRHRKRLFQVSNNKQSSCNGHSGPYIGREYRPLPVDRINLGA